MNRNLFHIDFHANDLPDGQCGAGFTIHSSATDRLPSAPVELEQAFPNEGSALKALLLAMAAHLEQRQDARERGEDDT